MHQISIKSPSTAQEPYNSAWCSWFITFDCNSNCNRKVPSSILGAENHSFLCLQRLGHERSLSFWHCTHKCESGLTSICACSIHRIKRSTTCLTPKARCRFLHLHASCLVADSRFAGVASVWPCPAQYQQNCPRLKLCQSRCCALAVRQATSTFTIQEACLSIGSSIDRPCLDKLMGSRLGTEVPALSPPASADDVRPAGSHPACIQHHYAPHCIQHPLHVSFLVRLIASLFLPTAHLLYLPLAPIGSLRPTYLHQ